MHSTPTQEVGRLSSHVAMQPLVPLAIEHAEVHLLGVQIDAAIEFALLIVESHHRPPWEAAREPLNHSKALSII
jgi:PIN domain nuclease of toxin-antitoxin system